jgi:ATP-dependent DNA ligase
LKRSIPTVPTARPVEPMLSLAVTTLPGGPERTYEVKFDDYRAQAIKTGG